MQKSSVINPQTSRQTNVETARRVQA